MHIVVIYSTSKNDADIPFQIFYVNSRTGEHSWDLPQETADEISGSELAGLSVQGTVRAATGAGMVFGVTTNINGINGAYPSEPPGLGIPHSTPEPWIKRLADDGMTFVFVNKHTGETTWTQPEHTDFNVLGSEPGLSAVPLNPRVRPAESKNGINSDLDVHPEHFQHSRALPQQAYQISTQTPQHNSTSSDLTSEELIARQLQQALVLPSSRLAADLVMKARDAIQAITDNVQANINRAGDEQRMDDLIQIAVRAVRNLLYVFATNSNQIPTDLLACETPEKPSLSSSLKPAQRRVTATLSRLVLSARAMYYDSGSRIAETLNRIDTDALELERAISLFIAEVQHCQQENGEGMFLKQLYGTFTTASIGVGLVGAGSAATWKGFGWVSQRLEEQAPRRPLGQDVMSEVIMILRRIEDLFYLNQTPTSWSDISGTISQVSLIHWHLSLLFQWNNSVKGSRTWLHMCLTFSVLLLISTLHGT